MTKTIVIGCDHRGFKTKHNIFPILTKMGFEYVDVGTTSEESDDYPIYAQKVAETIPLFKNAMGILICGSGIGVCIAANRFSGIRAATCRSTEEVEMTRRHNNANILCIGADVSLLEDVKHMVRAFLITRFEGGRHQRRIDLIDGGDTDGDELVVG